MRASYVVAASLLAGCFSDPSDVPFTYAVGGTVAGLWDGASITLHLTAGEIDETVTVDANGAFTFDSEVPEQTAFTVAIDAEPDGHDCTAPSGGTVEAAAIDDLAVNCDGPAVDIALSAPITWTFDVDTLAYALDVSTLIQQTAVTVTSIDATAIRLDDVDLAEATPSAPVALALGATTLTVDVEVGPAHRTFTVDLDRGAAAIEQYLYGKGANTGASDQFGYALASVGDTLAVGAPGESSNATTINGPDNDAAFQAGAVYVLRRVGAQWHQEAYIKASNARTNSAFGQSLAIQGDVLVVGAPSEDGALGTTTDSGAAYVFERVGETWSERAILRASSPYASQYFGWSVAIDGDVIVVGAIGDGSNGDSGTVYFFRRAGSQWPLEDEIKLNGTGATLDRFGASVGVSANRAVIGTPGFSAARAYVIEWNGTDWVQGQALLETPISASSKFGNRVEILGDTIVVASTTDACECRGVDPVSANTNDPSSGAVHVFRFDGSSWVREAFIKSSNSDAGDQFGWSIDLIPDRLIVGSFGEAGNGTGSAGDPDDNSASGAGAAYVFSRSGTTWAEDAYLKASNTESGDNFGYDVTISEESAASSAVYERSAAQGLDGSQVDNSALVAGAIYTFR